jgi:hypothetical protein
MVVHRDRSHYDFQNSTVVTGHFSAQGTVELHIVRARIQHYAYLRRGGVNQPDQSGVEHLYD